MEDFNQHLFQISKRIHITQNLIFVKYGNKVFFIERYIGIHRNVFLILRLISMLAISSIPKSHYKEYSKERKKFIETEPSK